MTSPIVWEDIEGNEWKGSEIIRAIRKLRIAKCAWVSINVNVNMTDEKRREEMRKFWNAINDCLKKTEKRERVVLFRDVN